MHISADVPSAHLSCKLSSSTYVCAEGNTPVRKKKIHKNIITFLMHRLWNSRTYHAKCMTKAICFAQWYSRTYHLSFMTYHLWSIVQRCVNTIGQKQFLFSYTVRDRCVNKTSVREKRNVLLCVLNTIGQFCVRLR